MLMLALLFSLKNQVNQVCMSIELNFKHLCCHCCHLVQRKWSERQHQKNHLNNGKLHGNFQQEMNL
jgi:hypothetical protein